MVQLGVIVTQEEYNFIVKLSNDANLSYSEFIRYMIKGLKYGVEITENPKKDVSIIVGEYGYSITPEDFTALTQDLEQCFNKVSKNIKTTKIKHDKGNKNPRFKSYKPMAKTA
jgi:hypothetical protein